MKQVLKMHITICNIMITECYNKRKKQICKGKSSNLMILFIYMLLKQKNVIYKKES